MYLFFVSITHFGLFQINGMAKSNFDKGVEQDQCDQKMQSNHDEEKGSGPPQFDKLR